MASKRARKPRAVQTGIGWAWAFRALVGIGVPSGPWMLCHWAEPDRERLVRRGKPTDDAVPVRVRLVPITRKRRKTNGK
jgi:hypothetical protein